LFGVDPYIFTIFKHQLHGFWLSLIDIVGVDLTKLTNYSALSAADDWAFSNETWQRLLYFNLLHYKLGERCIITSFINSNFVIMPWSLIFLNANWLERELVEFFGFHYTYRTDTRNLLLDYNFAGNPLLKSFPTEGNQELYFNYLSYNLEYTGAEFIEL
jgi:NADH:ubiquinone oxidoreductase subunit C